MSPSQPFIDPESGTLDTDQIQREAEPLLKLVVLFAVLGLVPTSLGVWFHGLFGALFHVVGQLVLAVGTAIVLMYVIARGIQLADT